MTNGRPARLIRLFVLLVASVAFASLVRARPAQALPSYGNLCDERTWVDSQEHQVTTHKFGGGACYGTPQPVHISEEMGYCSSAHPTCAQ